VPLVPRNPKKKDVEAPGLRTFECHDLANGRCGFCFHPHVAGASDELAKREKGYTSCDGRSVHTTVTCHANRWGANLVKSRVADPGDAVVTAVPVGAESRTIRAEGFRWMCELEF